MGNDFDALGNRCLAQERHQGIGIEPTLAGQSEAAARHAIAHQPGKPRGEVSTLEDDVVGAIGKLDAVIFLENGKAFRRGHDEVAVLVETHVGFRPELLFEVSHEPEAEFGKLDILRG